MKNSALAEGILAELSSRGETLASAESLTGGMIGALLTDVPGSSASYLGGVISYATRLKATLAGVDRSTLAEVGPVAERTAAEMARGVAALCGANWGVATTGVAGPERSGRPRGRPGLRCRQLPNGRAAARQRACAARRPHDDSAAGGLSCAGIIGGGPRTERRRGEDLTTRVALGVGRHWSCQ